VANREKRDAAPCPGPLADSIGHRLILATQTGLNSGVVTIRSRPASHQKHYQSDDHRQRNDGADADC
jgi:hypothetical protein